MHNILGRRESESLSAELARLAGFFVVEREVARRTSVGLRQLQHEQVGLCRTDRSMDRTHHSMHRSMYRSMHRFYASHPRIAACTGSMYHAACITGCITSMHRSMHRIHASQHASRSMHMAACIAQHASGSMRRATCMRTTCMPAACMRTACIAHPCIAQHA